MSNHPTTPQGSADRADELNRICELPDLEFGREFALREMVYRVSSELAEDDEAWMSQLEAERDRRCAEREAQEAELERLRNDRDFLRDELAAAKEQRSDALMLIAFLCENADEDGMDRIRRSAEEAHLDFVAITKLAADETWIEPQPQEASQPPAFGSWYAAVIEGSSGELRVNDVFWSQADAQRRVDSWDLGVGRVVPCTLTLQEASDAS